jgi:hypothetical protein
MTWPQVAPRLEQNVGSLSGVQPHTFAVPAPPQVCGVEHVPHEATVRPVPQLSVPITWPQFLPTREQNAVSLSAVQLLHTFAAPAPPQVPVVHVPHEATVRAVPQLSVPITWPQFLPTREQNAVSLSGVQPQTFAVPAPPQVWGEVHVPHEPTERG